MLLYSSLYIILFQIIVHTVFADKCSLLNVPSKNEKFHLVYQWKFINYTWPSYEVYQKAISTGLYIPGNSVILGVKFYKDKFYFALPKIKLGSPVTLAFVSKNTNEKENPLLTPYPNWSMHLSDQCSEILQNLQSMEIDETGLMWVIDGRRIDPTAQKCPPKIVLLDLNQNGTIVHSYIVPNEVCSHETCAMNDVVFDNVNGGFVYITDSSATDPGLIIYSRKQNKAWKVRDRTMFAEEDAIRFTTHGVSQSKLNNVNGIALAQRNSSSNGMHRSLYFTALSAFTLYSIDANVARNETIATSNETIHNFIKPLGNKTAQSSGMIVDTKGQLYYGLVAYDAILRWNTSKPLSSVEIIEENPDLMPWPDSYTFDDKGHLYLIASNVDRFSAGLLSINNYNFKLSKLYTGTCSYIYS